MQDTVRAINDKLRSVYKGGIFKAYYEGDPDVIPAFNLPAIITSKLGDTTTMGMTGHDRITERIVVKVVLDKRDDWSAQDDQVKLTERRICELVEGRDESGDYAQGTLKGALRRDVRLGQGRITGDVQYEIGLAPRSEDVVTAEGHLTITVITDVPVQRNHA